MMIMSKVTKPTMPSRCHCTLKGSQKGVALIMAILITSLVSIAAVAMLTEQQLDIRRTQNILHFDQAYVYVLGAEEWAKGYLANDETQNYDFYPVSEDNVDVIGLPIAEEVKQSGLDIGGISGIITDASAGFPLNNLVDANGERDVDFYKAFDHLVADNLEFNQDFSNVVLDWIDKNDRVDGGAEDMDYLNLTTPNRPYRTANRSISSVSELRLMMAMSDDATNAKNDYAALVRPTFNPLNAVSLEAIEQQPLVNALPHGAKININTAPKAVLKALVEYVGADDPEEVVNNFEEKRREQPQDNKEDNDFIKPLNDYVQSLKPRQGGATNSQNSRVGGNASADNTAYVDANKRLEKLKNEMIDVKSEYFYLTARAQIGDTDIMLISLLQRKDGKVKTLRRGLGVI
jgi:general secretion pathway protein K